jgi:hypothetical protein
MPGESWAANLLGDLHSELSRSLRPLPAPATIDDYLGPRTTDRIKVG